MDKTFPNKDLNLEIIRLEHDMQRVQEASKEVLDNLSYREQSRQTEAKKKLKRKLEETRRTINRLVDEIDASNLEINRYI
jgi:ElaB/YqjD/DUF883 family membrane-anchored ribosome-binding protein